MSRTEHARPSRAERAQRTDTCTYPGCIAIRDSAKRREWEDDTLCARHRQQERQRAGVCLNCAAPLREEPEVNLLTGRQLVRDGEPVYHLVCADDCGYSRRQRPARRRR